MEKIKLLHGDCLDLMKNIPDKSVDMILADPPYGTTACKWDSIIDLNKLWEQINRIIKNGAIVLFSSQPFTTKLISSNLEMFKYEWIWEKGRASGFVHSKNKPLKAHENIIVFSSGTTVHKNQSKNRMAYNPQMESGVPYVKKMTRVNAGMMNHKPTKSNIDFVGTINKNEGIRYPRSVIKFKMHNVGNFHPTQKPVELLEYMSKTYTNEEDIVLDFCMGSGSTGIACINTNRNFIGIEKENKYFELAKNRINEANMQI